MRITRGLQNRVLGGNVCNTIYSSTREISRVIWRLVREGRYKKISVFSFYEDNIHLNSEWFLMKAQTYLYLYLNLIFQCSYNGKCFFHHKNRFWYFVLVLKIHTVVGFFEKLINILLTPSLWVYNSHYVSHFLRNVGERCHILNS